MDRVNMGDMEIERNDRVMAADGSEIGRVTHAIVDSSTKQLTDIVVEGDGREMVIPIGNVQRSGGNLMLRGTASQMSGAAFMRDQYHEVDEDTLNAGTAPRAGRATVEHADEDSVVVDGDRAAGMTNARTDTTTTRTTPTPAPRRDMDTTRTDTTRRTAETVNDRDTMSVPVVEEQLRAGVREKEAGRFRLQKTVTQEQQSIDVPVQREEVYITTRDVKDRPATQADMAALDRDIEVPIREQEVVTSKQAVVTGEVDVRKETVTDTERVTDTVRREEVRVEGTNSDRVHTEGNLSSGQRSGTTRRDAKGNILDPDGDGENVVEEAARNVTEGTNRPGNRNR